MRVTAIELPARWGAPADALADVDAILASAPTDLALLPEASLTGYVSPQGDFDLAPFGEPLDGPTARGLAALAQRHRTHLVGPLIEADGAARHNAMIGFAPDGTRFLHYRKRHPWIPETWATPGRAPYPLVDLGGLEVTLAICYDVHFLTEEAEDTLAAADLLLFPSAWVDRADTRTAILQALSRRFGLAIVAANWGPGVVKVPGQGHSCIFGEGGRPLADLGHGTSRADADLDRKMSP